MMNCAYHHDHTATGICKQCCRALCVECQSTQLDSMACKDKCEPKIIAIEKIIDDAAQSRIILPVMFSVGLAVLMIIMTYDIDISNINKFIVFVLALFSANFITKLFLKKQKKN